MKITKTHQYSELINGKRVTFYGNSVDEIVSDVTRIRQRNGVKSPSFGVLYNSIKSKISETKQVNGADSRAHRRAVGSGLSPHNPVRSRSVSIEDASRAASALIRIIPGDYVNEDEYKRRLSICSGCELRQRNSDCMGCGGSGRAARILMSFRAKLGLGYRLDKGVGSQFCGFCGCSLSLLLVTKIKNYKKEDLELNPQRPSRCWLRKDSSNYVG
jgi:hypothetical protein